jgi:hypothetical protein
MTRDQEQQQQQLQQKIQERLQKREELRLEAIEMQEKYLQKTMIILQLDSELHLLRLEQQTLQQSLQKQQELGNENNVSLHAEQAHNGHKNYIFVVIDRVQFYGQNLIFSKIVKRVKPVHCPLILKLYFTISHTMLSL